MKNIRRKDRAIEEAEAMELLRVAEYGYLATVGESGQPYGIPISYALMDDAVYVHCAKVGHKLDNLAFNNQVSFCVVGKTRVLPDQFATEYESAVLFGRASVIDGEERQKALLALLEKYSPDHLESGKQYIESKDRATLVLRISIDQLSGKARR